MFNVEIIRCDFDLLGYMQGDKMFYFFEIVGYQLISELGIN